MTANSNLTFIIALMLLSYPFLVLNHQHDSGTHDADQPGNTSAAGDEVLTIAFCELVKNPRLYFDKTVRLTATLSLATEASYLSDDNCVLGHDDQIGVRYLATDEQQRDLLNKAIRKIRTSEYGSRARATVVGILRNSSRKSFAWYRYRFDIIRLEGMSPVIAPYEGSLQAGITYRAQVRGERGLGMSFVVPLRLAAHHAVHIEWVNLSEFPALEHLRNNTGAQQIVFTVISDELKQMTASRWNRTLQCKIITIE